ncbi:translocation/assembly module TamB domain-containing protein [bacterium]|nr:translocation/assembly module TamB domain-containing protein [bacterium]
MVRRPWIILVTLIVLSLAFAGLVTFRYINRSNVLRDRILEELTAIDGDFSIENASAQPGNLVLRNVSFRTPDSSLQVDIGQVSVRVEVMNMLFHRGDVTSVVTSISLEQPEITYWIDRGGSAENDESESVAPPDLNVLSELERIILIDGSFTLKTGRDDAWVTVWDVEGWVNRMMDERLNLNLSAALGTDTTRHIEINGFATLEDLAANARIDINQIDLSTVVLPESSPVYGLDGLFDFHADLNWDSTGWDADAHFQIDDATAWVDESGGLLIDRINLQGRVEDKLATTSGSVRFEGDDATIQASLALDSTMWLDGTTTIPDVHIGRHLGTFAKLKPKLQPQGTVTANGHLTGDLNTGELNLTAVATGDELWTEVGPFRDIHLDFSWDNQLWELRFDSLYTHWYGLDIVGDGRFRPSLPVEFLVEGDFTGQGERWNLPEWVEPITSKRAEGKVLIRKLEDEDFVVSGEARVRNGSNPAFGEFRGRYGRYSYNATLDLYSLRLPDAHFQLSQSMDDPVRIQTTQPQLVLSWWDDRFKLPERVERMDTQATAKITGDSVSVLATIADPVTGFDLDLSGLAIVDTSGAVYTVAGYNLGFKDQFLGNGDFEFTYLDDVVTIPVFTFMDYIEAQGEVDFNQDQFNDLTARVTDLDIGYLLPILTELPDDMAAGEINGQINFDGPFKQPDIDAHFEMFDGRYGELTDYWGLLTVDTDEAGNVNLRQGALGRGNVTLFTMLGGYSIPNDNLDLYLESPGSDANILVTTLTGKKDVILGDARFRGTATGSLLRPTWTADLDLAKGVLGGIQFDDTMIRMRGISSERLGHVVFIDTARLVRPDHYELSLSGAVPLDRGAGELDLSLQGDILELLPQWSSFITNANGNGTLNWSTTIVAGKPVAARGEMQIEDGNLEFADIFPPLTTLNMDVTIDTDGLVNIRKVQGEFVNEFPFEISNLPGESDNPKRQSIHWDLPEIDLGVLKIRTHQDLGIPFRLPGISTTERYAQLSVSGKNDEWLTIAGPHDSLYVDGQLSLLSATFTYPPIVEEDEQNILQTILPREALFLDDESNGSAAETPSFINNARWDVEAYVGHDVHYERIVKGLENAPFLETFSEFLGQVVLDISLEPTEPAFPIDISGALADTSFRLSGTIVSTTGRVEFLDLIFDVERAEVTFDASSVYPLVSARAVTTVTEENFSRQMYLTLYVIDPITGERQQRGRWGEFTFVLEDEQGSSQEEVLSAMGVGISDIQGLQNRFITSGAGGIDRAVARRYLGPIERDAADWLGLDIVQFRPQLATNIVGTNPSDIWYNTAEDDQRTSVTTSNRNLFRASRVTLGKYIDRDVYISYTGQFGEEARYASVEDIQLGRLGLLQKWNLQYRIQPISPNFVIEFGWEYENVEDQNNRSAQVKYSVVFDVMELSATDLWRNSFLK